MAGTNKFVLIKPLFQYENISLTSYSLSKCFKRKQRWFFAIWALIEEEHFEIKEIS